MIISPSSRLPGAVLFTFTFALQSVPAFPTLLIRMQQFRRDVLGDTLSAFDVCAVPEAFGADNVVPDSFERIEYRRRSDCPTRSPLPKRTVVRIEKIEGRGDTVIVHAYRDRGDLKHLEQYRFFYRGWMLVMDYTIPNGYTWR